MPRDPSLARHRPLQRSQIEETVTIKSSTAKRPRQTPSEPVQPAQKKQKAKPTAWEDPKKPTTAAATQANPSITRLFLLLLI